MSGRTGGVRVDVCRAASANAHRAVSNANVRITANMKCEGKERSWNIVTSPVLRRASRFLTSENRLTQLM